MKRHSSFEDMFKKDVPEGVLYYPCCGRDTFEPLSLFMKSVSQFHFADINGPILPSLECGGQGDSTANRNINTRRNFNFSREEVISTTKHVVGTQKSKNMRIICMSKGIGEMRFFANEIKYTWLVNSNPQREIEIYCHSNDAALTLFRDELNKISVFYYRGDSMGEGGSGQWWFGRELFDAVLDRLVPRGYIVTDGSNPNPNERDVPWKLFWEIRETDNPASISFSYRNKMFSCLGPLPEIRDTFVWQVLG